MTDAPETYIDAVAAQLRQREADAAVLDTHARATQKVKLDVFRLADEWNAVYAAQVRAITRTPPITRLPGAPAHILGVVNLGATAITAVLDVRPALGLRATAALTQTADVRLVVLAATVDDADGRTLLVAALVADQVSAVTDVPMTQIEPPLNTHEPMRAALITGTLRQGERMVTVLDTPAILTRFRL